MHRILATILILPILFASTVRPAQAVVECEWINNLGAGQNLQYCVGGFTSQAELQSHRVEFGCGQNCGLGGGGFRQFGDLGQPIGFEPETGTYFSCLEGQGITSEVIDRSTSCVRSEVPLCLGVGLVGAGITLLSGGTGAFALTWAVRTCGAAVVTAADIANCNVTFNARVVDRRNNSVVCSNNFQVTNEIAEDAEVINQRAFELCSQIPPTQTAQRDQCMACAIDQGVWTAIGCVQASGTSIVSQLVTIGLSVAGGVALLMILAAAFIFSTSQGDPKRTTEAKELLTSAVVGLLFIIFSITILQFIGLDLLRIPGFAV